MQLWMHGLLDADNDRRKEPYYHGDLIRLIASHPDFIFLLYPISGHGHALESILQNLRELRARLPSQNVDAVLLAWESSTLVSAFEKPLRRERKSQYKAQLQAWAGQGSDWNNTLAIIDQLEALAESGVAVITIAGNGGRGMVNTFSFARGVVTVGAIEDELGDFVSDNALVDRHEQAAYFALRVDSENGEPKGYDLDGDGCTDIPLSSLSGHRAGRQDYPARSWPPLKGSSFAAPRALKKILLEGRSQRGCR
ncbi:hypothetical protein [Marinobacterium aestuariivivens]|uniref:Peptidase S8/S53 domain-containing protein n=1 Tax=Marinobacterium aestuariivivens TaxID=1698799 RepID=A0ABW2A6Y5_9GAMM